MTIEEQISQLASRLGFDLIGFTKPEIDKNALKFYENFLKNSHHADMKYLEKIEPRKDLKKILPEVKSAICLGLNYYHPQKSLPKNHGRIARYAYGRDYHKIIGKMLKQFEAGLKDLDPKISTKSYVDTGPLIERALSHQAGLGTIGKNSCLINPKFGSWIFLCEILTNLDLKPTPQKAPAFSACGACTRCIQACPTQAIIAPGIIDSKKCISYLTIENKKQIPKKFHTAIKKSGYIFGCDICQQVCPHNIKNQQKTKHEPLLNTKIAGDSFPLKPLTETTIQKLHGSPLMRAKKSGLNRNIKTLTQSPNPPKFP